VRDTGQNRHRLRAERTLTTAGRMNFASTGLCGSQLGRVSGAQVYRASHYPHGKYLECCR